MRTLVLVDGEHHPSIVRWAVGIARDRGHDVAGALVVGGMEKFDAGADLGLGVPTLTAGDYLVATARGRPRSGAIVVVERPDRPGFEIVKRVREQLEEREEENEQLRSQLVGLRKEREDVRTRVEKMLKQIDALTSAESEA